MRTVASCRMALRHHLRLAARIVAIALLSDAATVSAQGFDDFEQEPIRYSASTPSDAVQQLEARLRAGEVQFEGSDAQIVRALLAELEVPIESQLLVFSKTSFQRPLISPSTPRALYFSDDVYVGWVPGGIVEVASIDAQLGPIFYRFDLHAPPVAEAPRLVRDASCLSCHGGQFVRGIPGVFVRSIHVEPTGEPLYRFGSLVIDEATPFEERFGGWYVTGTHGVSLHRGNTVAHVEDERLIVDEAAGANVIDLAGRFESSDYLAPGSDLVAMLVLQHQLVVHNAITRAGFQCRRLLRYQEGLQRDLHETVTSEPTYDSVVGVFDRSAQELVDALLSKGAAPLPEGGVTGDPAFQRAYAATARRDAAGESLRDLDLTTRLYRNRLSPLIDSASFAALPAPLLARVYARLAQALRRVDSDPRYAYLESPERARLVAILRETHRGLPEGWLASE